MLRGESPHIIVVNIVATISSKVRKTVIPLIILTKDHERASESFVFIVIIEALLSFQYFNCSYSRSDSSPAKPKSSLVHLTWKGTAWSPSQATIGSASSCSPSVFAQRLAPFSRLSYCFAFKRPYCLKSVDGCNISEMALNNLLLVLKACPSVPTERLGMPPLRRTL